MAKFFPRTLDRQNVIDPEITKICAILAPDRQYPNRIKYGEAKRAGNAVAFPSF